MAYLLTSYMISKGMSQFGGYTIDAKVSNAFNLSNAIRQSSSKWNGSSFCNNLDKGCAIFEKTLMNYL